MTHPRLRRLQLQARHLLAQASVIADGPGASFIPVGPRQNETKKPTTGGGCLFDDMKARFVRCTTVLDWEREVDWAEDALRRARKTPKAITERHLACVVFADLEAVEAAQRVGVSDRTIRRWRKEHKEEAAA